MKSCRTPSTLTEYSSVNPGRMNRATLPFTSTPPVRGAFHQTVAADVSRL